MAGDVSLEARPKLIIQEQYNSKSHYLFSIFAVFIKDYRFSGLVA